MKPSLVVLAAGIGSRYGGIKQIDPIGPSGEIILDYSLFDAVHAGFDTAVFVIRRDIEPAFRERIGRRWESRMTVRYVYQELSAVPAGKTVPVDRKKPWGTGHAVLSALPAVQTPFAVINADDFYGRESYQVLADYLVRTAHEDSRYCMVGYPLRNTLSENGTVARGLCETTPDGRLKTVVEITRIAREGERIVCQSPERPGHVFTGNEPVSLNLWGFKPAFFAHLQHDWLAFVEQSLAQPGAEFFLPAVVNRLVHEQRVDVDVLTTPCSWFGMTYPADKPTVTAHVRSRVESGEYPSDLMAYGMV